MASSSDAMRFLPPVDEDERLFVKRVAQMIERVRSSATVRTTPFCSDRQQQLAIMQLNKALYSQYVFDGGFQEAERKRLCIYGNTLPQHPFDTVCISIVPQMFSGTLTHRDYLGAVLGLGIKRECVGDICALQDGGVVLFAVPTAARLILEELCEVGRAHVSVQEQISADVSHSEAKTEHTASVASMRLDAVLAAMLHISRSDAQELIRMSYVQVNHTAGMAAHRDLCDGDVLSVRGHGKFQLCETGGKSKKGRTFITYIEY